MQPAKLQRILKHLEGHVKVALALARVTTRAYGSLAPAAICDTRAGLGILARVTTRAYGSLAAYALRAYGPRCPPICHIAPCGPHGAFGKYARHFCIRRSRMPKLYGYIRVSTQEQHDDRQRIALAEAGVSPKQLFIDKQSGKDFDRPQYQNSCASSNRATHWSLKALTDWAGITPKSNNNGTS